MVIPGQMRRGRAYDDGEVDISALCDGGADIDEAIANARLIAAAPELYEACLNARERLKDACQHGYVAAKTLQQLDAALAKAEGSIA